MGGRVLVVGASVAGATAAEVLARAGVETLLLERELGRPKPCGGAVPPAAFTEFDIPERVIDRKVRQCVVLSPRGAVVQFPVVGSVPGSDDFVAMVRREVFDGFLRERAQEAGATLMHGGLVRLYVLDDRVEAVYRDSAGRERMVGADAVIGADGAYSTVGKFLGVRQTVSSVGVQERIALPPARLERWAETADMILGPEVSPDFYGWVFPKGDHVTVGVGVGRAHGRKARQFLANLKVRLGSALEGGRVVAFESHGLPMQPCRQLAFDRAMLVGDAAGLVARTSGEGIYWAMRSGAMAAEVLAECADVPSRARLRRYEQRWWGEFGGMYAFLRGLEWWGYGGERQMEVFARMCRNEDVQRLTFDSYMYKRLVRAPWGAQMRMTRDILVNQVAVYTGRG
jgi:geranylgeranyl diphosphate/geranylgeranyl-bacteriochlorophyllide a reductase